MDKTLVRTILFMGVVFVYASHPLVTWAADCKAQLIANVGYKCHFTSEFDDSFDLCTYFYDNTLPGKFAWFISDSTLSCTCQASGGASAPKFNQSKAFLCGLDGTFASLDNLGDAAIGQVVGAKVKKGQYLDVAPRRTLAFDCVPDPTCPI